MHATTGLGAEPAIKHDDHFIFASADSHAGSYSHASSYSYANAIFWRQP
jgi:hypothetical protein